MTKATTKPPKKNAPRKRPAKTPVDMILEEDENNVEIEETKEEPAEETATDPDDSQPDETETPADPQEDQEGNPVDQVTGDPEPDDPPYEEEQKEPEPVQEEEGGEQFKFKKDADPEEKKKKEKKGMTIKGNAIVTGIDIFFSRSLAFIAGESYQRFKLDKEEKEELNEVAKDIEIKITPEILFLILLVAIYSTRIAEAVDIRIKKFKEKKAAKQKETNMNVAHRNDQAPPPAPQESNLRKVDEPAPEELAKPRKDYEVDSEMYFKRNRGGVYLRKNLRTEKATKDDFEKLIACKKNDATFIRKYFGIKKAG